MRMSECSSDVCSSDLAEIAAKAKGKVKAFPCDVTDPQQIEALFPKIESTLGPVDILVNNAGSSARAPFLEITDATWQAAHDLKDRTRVAYGKRVSIRVDPCGSSILKKNKTHRQ